MDSIIKLSLERAENEINLANVVSKVSQDETIKDKTFNLKKDTTFYSAVISHSYYAIFYSAKAYLLSQGILFTNKQGQHQKVHYEFSKLVKKGIIDKKLLEIYEDALVKAEKLLDILVQERKKRTEFTYERLPQANKGHAQESLNNATLFYSSIVNVIGG